MTEIAAPVESSPTYVFGPFVLDARRRLLSKGSEVKSISEKLFRLLQMLLEAGGKTVTKEEFFDTLWSDDEGCDANLKQHIFMLRTLLGDVSEIDAYIVTVSGHGYRLGVPVERKNGLLMKELCVRCHAILSHRDLAYICSFECTYCADCTSAVDAVCKDCRGELVPRPRRVTL